MYLGGCAEVERRRRGHESLEMCLGAFPGV